MANDGGATTKTVVLVQKECYTPAEVEMVYGIKHPRLCLMFKDGLRSIKLGRGRNGSRLIRKTDLDEYLTAHLEGGK